MFSNLSSPVYYLYQTVWAFLLAHQFLLDGLRVAIAGIFFEGARRGFMALVNGVAQSFTLTVRFQDTDDAYSWLENYLSQHASATIAQPPSFFTSILDGIYPNGRSAPRDAKIETKATKAEGDGYTVSNTQGIVIPGTRVTILPYYSAIHVVKFQGRAVKFSVRCEGLQSDSTYDLMTVSVSFSTHRLIQDLLVKAREDYMKASRDLLKIYTPHPREYCRWKCAVTKDQRPWDSVILPSEIKDNLLKDALEFLQERDFYRDRGLPYRRGYLLHGQPGSGKSSLIAAIASKLSLNIYIVNIGATEMDDDLLAQLLRECPSEAILLMEDIDCAFVDRQKDKPDEAETVILQETSKGGGNDTSPTHVTLSGLLNALDGVASSEGRLLFCTTNHADRIDPALSRPGRCDVWVEFSYVSPAQAYHLFLHFYPQPGVEVKYEFTEGQALQLLSLQDSTPTSSKSTSPDNGWPQLGMSPTEGKLPIDEKQDVHVHSGDILKITCSDSSKTLVDLAPSREQDKVVMDIEKLALEFVSKVPENSISMSALTAYLMRYKRQPEAAVKGLDKWVKEGFPRSPTASFTIHK